MRRNVHGQHRNFGDASTSSAEAQGSIFPRSRYNVASHFDTAMRAMAYAPVPIIGFTVVCTAPVAVIDVATMALQSVNITFQLLSYFVVVAAPTTALLGVYAGRRLTWRQVLRAIGRRWWPMLITMLCLWFFAGLALLGLVGPIIATIAGFSNDGITPAVAVAISVAALLVAAGSYYMHLRLYTAPTWVVWRHMGVGKALATSWRLSHGFVVKTAVVSGATTIAATVLSTLVMTPFVAVAATVVIVSNLDQATVDDGFTLLISAIPLYLGSALASGVAQPILSSVAATLGIDQLVARGELEPDEEYARTLQRLVAGRQA